MIQTAPTGMFTPGPHFCAALELSLSKWKIGFSYGGRDKLVTIDARDWKAFDDEVLKARVRFEVPDGARLFTCYEAGRDGFWIHRELLKKGIDNIVVDPSSIEVPRRARRAKTDSLDARALVERLAKYRRGEPKVWQVVKAPTVQEEDARRLHRERERLTKERTGHVTRVKSLLALFGVQLKNVFHIELFEEQLPERLRSEVKRELERLKLVNAQLKLLVSIRAEAIEKLQLPNADKIQKLVQLKGIGPTTSTILVSEMFGWRDLKNGKQVGACAGLAPTPFASGTVDREQGISKAGNKRVRTLCVEIAWGWLRWQPQSALSKWFEARFGKGSGRSRRVGIVALARKLLVALWRYLKFDTMPEGALVS